MPGIDYSSPITNAAALGPAAAPAKTSGLSDFTFADFLDIINPLQHIPVVSTIYRAITGDRPGTPEKIAGDTLYGGVIGLVASLADTAFKEITGKDVGDTVLAFLSGNDTTQTASSPALPAAAPEQPAAVVPAKAVSAPGMSALMSVLSVKGVDGDTAARAAYAYGRTIGLTTAAAELPPV
ncbi:MAG: hypothetical protein KGM97_05460 [Alphaproteobacteria bacterium]|nr:hypothetical protein [Alphaproteobacteria bacterium]MDE2630420.1 hypothetical protein [Alphaproteobacteria bacterium]